MAKIENSVRKLIEVAFVRRDLRRHERLFVQAWRPRCAVVGIVCFHRCSCRIPQARDFPIPALSADRPLTRALLHTDRLVMSLPSCRSIFVNTLMAFALSCIG